MGQVKAIIENVLMMFQQVLIFNHVSLRYFNAAGADTEGRLGKEKEASHLITTCTDGFKFYAIYEHF